MTLYLIFNFTSGIVGETLGFGLTKKNSLYNELFRKGAGYKVHIENSILFL